MSGILYMNKENNEKLVKRKGHFQRAPAESNSDLPSTINTTVESFNAFGINNESLQIDSSEDDLPLRSPFVKNTIPADLLARQLAQVVEHQPQLSSEEKVHTWRWEAVVSPIEDVLNFQKHFEQREATFAINCKRKSTNKKSKNLNDMMAEEEYNFAEFRQRLQKALHDNVNLSNILLNSRCRPIKNITTNVVKKNSQPTRKRAKKAVFDSEQEPKIKISKKSTTKLVANKVQDQPQNIPKAKAAIAIKKQTKKPTANTKKQELIKINPMTKRQEQLKLKKIANEQIAEAKLQEKLKEKNGLIVFREDFTNKTLHLDKKRAQIFKIYENSMPNNNSKNHTNDNKMTTSTIITATTTANPTATTTTLTTSIQNNNNNNKQQNSTINDNSSGAGVFHQQHVFCNYLGLTGMSTAAAVANAVAELSNCATRRRSLRVRHLQQKEKQNQTQAQVKQVIANQKSRRSVSISQMSTKPLPPKIQALDIKRAKEISFKKPNIVNIATLRSKFSLSERQDPAPIRIVHRFSSISEDKPKPKEPSIFIPPKLKSIDEFQNTTPAKRIFSPEFAKQFQPKFVPAPNTQPIKGKIHIIENKILNNPTSLLMTSMKSTKTITTTSNLIPQHRKTISLMTAPKRSLLAQLKTLKYEKRNCLYAEMPKFEKIETSVAPLLKPLIVEKVNMMDISHLKQESTNVQDNVKQESNETEVSSLQVSNVVNANLHESTEKTKENVQSEIEEEKAIEKDHPIFEKAEEVQEKEQQGSILEEKPLIDTNSNLNLKQNIENDLLQEKKNEEITVDTIKALTANEIIFADDFMMTVKNENGTENIISDNVDDLIEEVDETDDINEHFVVTNNMTNVDECLQKEPVQNNHITVDELNINNVHSIEQFHKNIEIIDIKDIDINKHITAVSDLPLILCSKNNTNSQEHENDTKNSITNNLQEEDLESVDLEIINENGTLDIVSNNAAEQATLVNNVGKQAFSNNVAMLMDNNTTTSDEKNISIQNLYKNIQYLHKISTKQTQNPLKYEYGSVLYIYYELDVLLVVQELMISFWKCSKLLNALKIAKLEELECNKNEWLLLDLCPRSLKDIEISAPYSSRICIYNAMTVYLELRGYHAPPELGRTHNFFSLYVNVYYYHEEELQGKMRTITLDSVQRLIKYFIK